MNDSDEKIIQFVPRFPEFDGDGPARELYQVYREQGFSKEDAFGKALQAVLGIDEDQAEP